MIPRLALPVIGLIALSGCRIDILRVRSGEPLDPAVMDKLTVKETTLVDTLEMLGAPDKVEWKSGENYLWYQHADFFDAGLRYRLPVLGLYQHTFLRVGDDAEQLNQLQLVFDEENRLSQKSIQLADEYAVSDSEDDGKWVLRLAAHGEYATQLAGDGGVDDFDDLFDGGYRAGLEVGFRPVPVLTVFFDGSFHEYRGDDVFVGDVRWNIDDLQLYQFEVGVRLTAPLKLFSHIDDSRVLRRILFDEDIRNLRGTHVYIQGSTGVTLSNNVPVTRNGERNGTLYDNEALFSGSVGAGIEYTSSWGVASVGFTFFNTDPLNEGSSPLDGDTEGFSSVLVGGSLGLRF